MVAVLNYLRLSPPTRCKTRSEIVESQQKTREKLKKRATKRDNQSPRHRARLERRAMKEAAPAPRNANHARQRKFRTKLPQPLVDEGHANDVTSAYIRKHGCYNSIAPRRRPSAAKLLERLQRLQPSTAVKYWPRGDLPQRSAKVVHATITNSTNKTTFAWVYVRAPRARTERSNRNPFIAVPIEFVSEV